MPFHEVHTYKELNNSYARHDFSLPGEKADPKWHTSGTLMPFHEVHTYKELNSSYARHDLSLPGKKADCKWKTSDKQVAN